MCIPPSKKTRVPHKNIGDKLEFRHNTEYTIHYTVLYSKQDIPFHASPAAHSQESQQHMKTRHSNTLQHAATHSNTLQHAATQQRVKTRDSFLGASPSSHSPESHLHTPQRDGSVSSFRFNATATHPQKSEQHLLTRHSDTLQHTATRQHIETRESSFRTDSFNTAAPNLEASEPVERKSFSFNHTATH